MPDTTLEPVFIGRTDLRVPPLGVGTWAWGEKKFWSYEQDYGPDDLVEAFLASVRGGLTLFDTAEVYGHGASEQILGYMASKWEGQVALATKFALLPGRNAPGSFKKALDASLRRLRVDRIDLYQVHWPDGSMATVESLMDAMADAVEAGKVRAVGVSNFSADETRRAHAALARRGVPLASNQVHYSLLHRAPEVNGVLDVCRELGVTLLAYSPLEQGLLTGKYGEGKVPRDGRARTEIFTAGNVQAAQAVVGLLREVGARHGGKEPGQVALNWLLAQPGVLPIPGAKNRAQAEANLGALGWALSSDEAEELSGATHAWKRA